jgi:hypothetical protein
LQREQAGVVRKWTPASAHRHSDDSSLSATKRDGLIPQNGLGITLETHLEVPQQSSLDHEFLYRSVVGVVGPHLDRDTDASGPSMKPATIASECLRSHGTESSLYIPSQKCLDSQQAVQKLYEWDAKPYQQFAELPVLALYGLRYGLVAESLHDEHCASLRTWLRRRHSS